MGALAAGAVPAQAASPVSTQRLSGVDRYGTAAAIAQAKFPTGVATALVASGLNYPDALAGAYLAGQQGAAILLTDPNTLLPATSNALTALHVKNVIILGGTTAVAPAVANAIAALTSTALVGGTINVSRIGGLTRYDTMQMIDETPHVVQVGVVNGLRTAIIASGANFPDALAASAASYHNKLPVVLTDPNTMLPQTKATLQDLQIAQVLIMGGSAAVTSTINQAITNMGIAVVQQFAGTDRTDTAQQFASYEVANLGFNNTEVTLARGDTFPDALTGGVYAGDPKPIIMTEDPNTLGTYSCSYLNNNSSAINRITAFGGFQAIADTTLATAVACAQGNSTGSGGGGIGGNGGGGGVVPGGAPVTNAPDLVSATLVTNGFATGSPSTVQYTFDKSVAGALAAPSHFGAIGPDTTATSPDFGATACVIDPDGLSVDCQFPATENVAARTMVEVDGGSVFSASGHLPNVLNVVPLSGGNNLTFPSPILTSAAVSSAAFNQITYTFNQNVQLVGSAAASAAHFGFTTSDGQTEDIGATNATPSGNTVTVTFPAAAPVTTATQFFVLRNGVKGTSSGFINPDTSVGTASSRVNLVSVTRTAAPNQFLFTVDRPSVVVTPADFQISQTEETPPGASNPPVSAISAVPVGGSSTFLVTFPAATVTNANSSQFVWGGLLQTNTGVGAPTTVTGGALKTAAAPVQFNAVTGVAIGGGTTAIANGPLLQSWSGSIGAAQGTFVFDRPIAAASVVPTDFFVVENNGTAVPGVSTVAVTGNEVIIKFPAAAVTSLSVGGGLIGPFEEQPGVNGGATGTAATDSAGNPAVGLSVGGTST
jgi:putative cell wall-binding protein